MAKTLKTATATIESLNADGCGVAHLEQKTLFIQNALPGETVEFYYTKCRQKAKHGIATKIILPSPERVEPPCEHYATCGGCTLQHLAPQAQITLKETVVKQQLQHAGINVPSWLPPLTASSDHYRTRARLSVKYLAGTQRLLIGFHEPNGRFVNQTEHCLILNHWFSDLFPELRKLLLSLSNYNTIPQLELACGTESAAIIIRNLQPFTDDDYKKLAEFTVKTKIVIYEQPKGLDSVKLITATHNDLSYNLNDFSIRIAFQPYNFTQINAAINQQLVKQALNLLQLQPSDRVLDLFCGIGNFTLPIATKVSHVTGVEGDAAAIQQAKLNTELNCCQNGSFYVADLTKVSTTEPWWHSDYDKILLDPPRTGASEICHLLASFTVPKIVYVSCNPATLARDLAILTAGNYSVVAAGIADMYPHTRHVETIALIERVRKVAPEKPKTVIRHPIKVKGN